MSRFQALLALTLLIVGASCVTSPYDGQQISGYNLNVEGFVDTPGATVRVDAYDWSTSTYYAWQWTTAQTVPYAAAGAICPNSPPLYSYTANVNLWLNLQWRRDLKTGRSYAKLKATELYPGENSGSPLFFTNNPNGPSCMFQHITPNCDFFNIASVCGYTLQEATISTTSPP